MTETSPFGLRVVTPDDNYVGPTGHGGLDDTDEFAESALARTHAFAVAKGDISHLLTTDQLSRLGARAVEEWRRDDGERATWKAEVDAASKAAAQEAREYSGEGSNVRFPILTQAALGWAARAYPALVKGDQIFGIKRIGAKPKPPVPMPQPPPDSPPQLVQMYQAAVQEHQQQYQAAMQQWQAVEARAKRVETFLNHQVFYKSGGDWEQDEDILLSQLPIVGCAFKKVWWDAEEKRVRSELVHALRLTLPMEERSIDRSPRATQEFEIYPYEIAQGQRSGQWRDIDLIPAGDDPERPRKWIEQHRVEDLDGDGLPEPYVLTVDVEQMQVMRVEAEFAPEDVELFPAEPIGVAKINRWSPYIAFSFMPDLKGRIYAMGFGKLLADVSDVLDTIINQQLDAGAAQVRGGGFISSGLRLQGSGQSSTVRFKGGQFQVVNAPAGTLRDAIWERTLPEPSAVSQQMLELLLEAAKEIGSIKDILSGNTPATAPVGTTLAVANQALQPFSATFKRLYRSTYQEGMKIYECIARYAVGDQEVEQEYMRVTGAQPGDFAKDFAGPSSDVIPVADPNVVTQQQAMARAQVGVELLGNPALAPVLDRVKIATDVLEAAQFDDPQSYIVQAPPPDPIIQAKVQDIEAAADLKGAQATAQRAGAIKDLSQASHIGVLAQRDATEETPAQAREHQGLVDVARTAAELQLQPEQGAPA